MKLFQLILFLVFAINFAFAQNQTIPLKFKAKIGFVNSEDKFERYKFIEDGKKAVFVGKNNIQVWDVENLKPINNITFTPQKYDYTLPIQKILLLGLIKLEWETVEVDPNGRWFVSFEGEKSDKRAVVRDLYTGDQLAILQMPALTEYISVENGEISLVSKENKDSEETKIGYWDGKTLQEKGIISIKDYRFHKRIPNSDKVLVGFRKTRRAWIAPVSEKSGQMTIINLKTGAIEREFTASNLLPNDFYYETQITEDQKFLIAKRDKRVIVWDLAGNGQPKFEIKSADPKESVEIGKIIDGKLLPATFGKTTRFYELDGNGTPKYEFPEYDHKNKTGFIKFIKDGRFAAFMSGYDIELKDLQGDQNSKITVQPPAEKETISRSHFFDNDKHWVIERFSKVFKSYQTEFYNTETGSYEFGVPFSLGYSTFFTTNRKYLVTERLGDFIIWNFETKKSFTVPIKYSSTACDSNDTNCTTQTSNDEYLKLSLDEKFIIKHSYSKSVVIDLETGKEVQEIFNAEEVKYNKQNKIERSGASNLEYLPNGFLVVNNSWYRRDGFDLEEWRYCSGCQTISIWERAN